MLKKHIGAEENFIMHVKHECLLSFLFKLLPKGWNFFIVVCSVFFSKFLRLTWFLSFYFYSKNSEINFDKLILCRSDFVKLGKFLKFSSFTLILIIWLFIFTREFALWILGYINFNRLFTVKIVKATHYRRNS